MFNISMPEAFHISRRSFLRNCAATAAATGLPLWFVQRELAEAAEEIKPALPRSPNDRPGIALIGCGGQGSGDLQNASRYGNVVALCDVKESSVANAAKRYGQNGPAPFTTTDFRKILERKDVHIIVNGTPDH